MRELKRTPNTLERANIFSVLSYSYLSKLLKKGNKHVLQLEDLYEPYSGDNVIPYAKIFSMHWEEELVKYRATKKSPNLHWALAKTLKDFIFKIILLGLLDSALRVAQPVLLGEILMYFSNPDTSSKTRAYVFASLFSLSSFVFMVVHHFFFFYTKRFGAMLRIVSSALIYENAIQMSAEAQSKISTGFIVNLLSVDMSRFDIFGDLFYFIIAALLESLAILPFLWMKIGYASIFCLVVYAIMAFFQFGTIKFLAKLRRKTTVISDHRIKKVTEILNSIRVIKMLGWGNFLESVVKKLRAREIKFTFQSFMFRAFSYALYTSCGQVACLTVFSVYLLQNKTLTPELVFSSMSLIYAVRLSVVYLFSVAIQSGAESDVCIQRMKHFLLICEADRQRKLQKFAALPAPEEAQNMNHADTATIASNNKPAFVHINDYKCIWEYNEEAHRKKTKLKTKKLATSKPQPKKENKSLSSTNPLLGPVSYPVTRVNSRSGSGLDRISPATFSATAAHDALGNHSEEFNEAIERQLLTATSVSTHDKVPMEIVINNADGTGPIVVPITERTDYILDATVSIRTAEHMATHQLVDNEPEHSLTATAYYSSIALQKITFRLSETQFMGVIGEVGSGKSTLLLALLQELTPVHGSLAIHGRVSYASQEPWIMPTTIRDNILFGSPYDEVKYNKVIQVCCLERDLSLFPRRDLSEIAERGSNLSGGQRARVALARAVYREADIYLLDDPLSAVDAKVGRQMVEQCIKGYLKDKIVILATHQLQFIPSCNSVLLLKDGTQQFHGTYNQLLAFDPKYIKATTSTEEDEEEDEPPSIEQIPSSSTTMAATHASSIPSDTNDNENESESSISFDQVDITANIVSTAALSAIAPEKKSIILPDEKHASENLNNIDTATAETAAAADADAAAAASEYKMNKSEEIVEQSFSFKVYYDYIRAGSHPALTLLLILAFLAGNALLFYTDFFFGQWADKPVDDQEENRIKYWLIYAGLVVGVFVMNICRSIWFYKVLLSASKTLHNKMLSCILHVPTYFFDETAVGIILNRFSKDIGVLDDMLAFTLYDLTELMCQFSGVLVLVGYTNPYMFIVVAALMTIFVWLRIYFVATSRQLKNLDSVTKSPLFSHLAMTLTGSTIIRAFNMENPYNDEFLLLLNDNGSAWMMFLNISRWLGFRLDVLCSTFITCAAFGSVILSDSIGASEAGLALTYSLTLQGNLQWMVRQTVEAENYMVSTQRVLEYTELESELPEHVDSDPAPHTWPQTGDIIFSHVNMRYRPHLPLALKDLNLSIKGGEKIGIIGRTGAGKSTIMSALFRLIEYERDGGYVEIGGIKTHTLGLNILRSSISVIPQEPVLFSGTLRDNLDPLGEYNDADIWEALDGVNLRKFANSLGKGLEGHITDSGSNLSVGQRQLVCLARAILSRNKILMMDEATANVDLETDRAIQIAIREKFKTCTILTIAHRLYTVMDSDKILVMDKGACVEFGSPKSLLKIPGGYFASLVEETEMAKKESSNNHHAQ